VTQIEAQLKRLVGDLGLILRQCQESERERLDATLARYGMEIDDELRTLTLVPPEQTSSKDTERVEFDLSRVRTILLRERNYQVGWVEAAPDHQVDDMTLESIRDALRRSNIAQQDLRAALEKV